MAGSKRSRSLSWMARHSVRLRAHTPGRIEALQDRQHGLDLGGAARRASRATDRKIAAEVAGLVDEIDQILPDHAPHRIGDRKRELLGEMIGKRCLGRDEGFEIVVAVVAAAGCRRRPIPNSRPVPRRSSASSRHRLAGGTSSRSAAGRSRGGTIAAGLRPVGAGPSRGGRRWLRAARAGCRAPRRLLPARSSSGLRSSSPST